MGLIPRLILLSRNQDLLNAVARMDWKAYAAMCAPSLSCFEQESRAHFVEGLEFHKIYYDAAHRFPVDPATQPLKQVTMASPHVRLVGRSCAILSYVRLVQSVAQGAVSTARAEETRIWERQKPILPKDPAADAFETEKARWRLVHFHRSQWD